MNRPAPRRILAAAACLLLAGCTQSPVEGTPAFARAAEALPAEAGGLQPLFEALWALETGQRAEPVTIIQFGDSHTAGDRFSGRLRERFQAAFGSAGRGMLPPGVPFEYFRPALVTVEQSSGWQVANSFNQSAGGLFGLTGFRLSTERAGETIAVTSTEEAGFDRAAIEFMRQPGGGTVSIRADGVELHRQPTADNALLAGRVDLSVPAGSRRLELRTEGGGPVTVLGWVVERSTPGIIYDSHGIVGASVHIVGAWEPGTVAWELASRNPALIILAYGTNEGFADDLEAEDYAMRFAETLAFLRRAAPRAALLVVGPPDANRLPRNCPARERERGSTLCAPLSAYEVANYRELFGGTPRGNFCRWHPPPNLAVVRDIQRSAAAAQGVYFWDWSQVMGGDCGTHQWAQADPPLAFTDHVHFKPEGYVASADALFDELMAHYAVFRAALGGTP